MYSSATVIHIKTISFKIISLLVLFVLNLYNKTFVGWFFFLAFRFIFMHLEAEKHGNAQIFSYSLFKFLNQIYISSSLELNSKLVLCGYTQ